MTKGKKGGKNEHKKKNAGPAAGLRNDYRNLFSNTSNASPRK